MLDSYGFLFNIDVVSCNRKYVYLHNNEGIVVYASIGQLEA